MLGGLLAAHLLIEDERNTFGNLEPDWYTGDLLTLAHDLADRLLMAFDDETDTGIPHPRVHLQDGVPSDGKKVSNSAGAGSLILEFGNLSLIFGFVFLDLNNSRTYFMKKVSITEVLLFCRNAQSFVG